MIFLTPSPDIIPLTISIILYVILLGLDVVVPWLKPALSRFLNYANITLHIAFILSLMFVGVYIEVPVLAFMISLFAYSLSSFFAYKRGGDCVDTIQLSVSDEDDATAQNPDTVLPVLDSVPDITEAKTECSHATQDDGEDEI